ncbi:E3 ubiquitin-protein ligase RFI2-like [Papaver somniferum]|uniref:E3 ubiquitin-protein ligase RFI2-like n=1 Tax=Papaver somniferum TaxID=3469 RepID=UPI000E6FF243|nr:E3 ubiquitin-protein ligase RFI2-like [Papaver somniferum]
MGLGDLDSLDDDEGGNGGGGRKSVVEVSLSYAQCSICLDVIEDNGERSRAKLYCGHEFHLDCIGSAFNSKGVMQCPNCRKIEKGQWLFANGHRSCPELSMDDMVPEEDLYDLSYTEMSFGVQWCPYNGLTRVSSSFEEGDSPSNAYQELLGHHPIFAEHTAPSSVAHSCPYIPYFNPFHSSLNSNESAADRLSFSHHWNGLSGLNDISTTHAFSAVDVPYPSWEHQSPPSFTPSTSHGSSADQASVPSTSLRPTRGDADGQVRPGPFVCPILLGNGSGSRAGSSSASSMVPPYPNNSSRGHERMFQGLHAFHQQQQTNPIGLRAHVPHVRRSSGPRGLAASAGPVTSSSDRTSGFFVFPSSSGSSGQNIQETENQLRTRFYAWERDRFAPFPLVPVDRESNWWGPFHQASSGSDPSSRGSYWHRYGGSERMPSQSRSESSHYQPLHHPSGRMHPFI